MIGQMAAGADFDVARDRWTWPQLRRYWETHSAIRADVDWDLDPDGLDNVCGTGSPRWLNGYYAAGQRAVYESLLCRVPSADRGSALEVGCGAGRWCRLLEERGYSVTGIDLQPELIGRNRERYPTMRFERCAIQEFTAGSRARLVSSVTVLQHLPHGEQARAVDAMRRAVEDGGHAIVLENLRDQAPHVFPRSIDGWTDLFSEHGFGLVATVPYDYNPSLRVIAMLREAVRGRMRGAPSEGERVWSTPAARAEHPNGAGPIVATARAVSVGFQRIAVAVDSRIEPELVARRAPFATVHCGFLFRAEQRGRGLS